MGLFSINPVQWVESVKDEDLKRSVAQVAISLAYSQYITFMFELGTSLSGRRFTGFLSSTFQKMAASAFIILSRRSGQKLVDLAIPKAMIDSPALLDSIYWEEIQEGGK